MAGTPGHSGGARPGAGRKSNNRVQSLEPARQHIDERLEQTLDQRLATLEQLAAGGLQSVTERWELAGTLLIDGVREVLDSQGVPTGQTVPCKVPAFPDKPADQLVLVSRTVKTLAPNLAANIYLVNRLLGKPVPAEGPMEEPQPDTLSEELEAAIARIYGEAPLDAPPPAPHQRDSAPDALSASEVPPNVGAGSPCPQSPCPSDVAHDMVADEPAPIREEIAPRPGCNVAPETTIVPPRSPRAPDTGILPPQCSVPERTVSERAGKEVGFVAGTPVLTAEGNKPIEQIREGDLVWTRCGWKRAHSTGQSGHNVPVITIGLANGTSFTATPDQLLWVKDRGWVAIAAMQGQSLLVPPNPCDPKALTRKPAPPAVAVIAIDKSSRTADTWSLEVGEQPEYFAAGFLVK